VTAAARPSRPSRPTLLTPAFLALAVAVLAYFIADGMPLPVLPPYVLDRLGGDELALGIVFGAFSLTAIILRPWAGRASDVRGRRPLIVAGCVLFAIGMLGHLVAVSIPLLIVMRLILGVAEAFLFVAALSAANDLAPDDRRGEAVSLISLSLYLGVAVGPFIGETILGDGRFAAVWVTAAAMAGLAALLALRMPETVTAEARAEAEVGAATPRVGIGRFIHPAGVLPGLVLLASTAGMGGFFAFSADYARGIGLPVAWPVFLLFAAIVIGFRSLAPWMPDRLGHRRAATLALTFDAIGLGIIALWGSPPGLFLGTAVFAFGVCFAFPALSAMVTASVPRAERGAALGTFSAALDLAFGLGPIVLGFVASVSGYRPMYGIAAVFALAGLALLWLTRARPLPAPGTATSVH
jgi:MFS family permease